MRDATALRQGDREDILSGLPKVKDDRPFVFAVASVNALQLALITAWEVPYLQHPTRLPAVNPKTGHIEAFRELTCGDADVIAAAAKEAQELLFPKPPVPDDEQLDDPQSPTEPASE
jgi:hypothetical protein